MTKAKELDNRKNGDRNACKICAPKKGRITEDQLWRWAMKQSGKVWPWR